MKISDGFWAKFRPKNAKNHRWEMSRMSTIGVFTPTQGGAELVLQRKKTALPGMPGRAGSV